MQATPLAAFGFIMLVLVLMNTGPPAAVLTFAFLMYAPAYLALSCLWDWVSVRVVEWRRSEHE